MTVTVVKEKDQEEEELVKIPVTQITIIRTAGLGLSFNDGTFPIPRHSDRTKRNANTDREADELGTTVRNINQFTRIKGINPYKARSKKVIGSDVVRMIREGGYWGLYFHIQERLVDDEGKAIVYNQLRVELRSGPQPPWGTHGLLERDHIDTLCEVLEEIELFCEDIWVDSKKDTQVYQACLLLSPLDDYDETKRLSIPNVIQKDSFGFYVELGKRKLEKVRPKKEFEVG